MASNYKIMMEQMTPEALAEKNVHLVTVDNRRLFYMTSSGQLFNSNQFEAAVQHEYAWLMYDPENVDKSSTEGEPDCAGCETECSDCPNK